MGSQTGDPILVESGIKERARAPLRVREARCVRDEGKSAAGLCPGRRVIDLPRRVGPCSGETAGGWLVGWLTGWRLLARTFLRSFARHARLSAYRQNRTLRGINESLSFFDRWCRSLLITLVVYLCFQCCSPLRYNDIRMDYI